MNQKIVVVGATSAIAEHCARIWVSESPSVMVLLGRDQRRTEAVAQDLRVRSPLSEVIINVIDFEDSRQIQEWVDQVCESGVPDIVLIAHGSLPDQQACQKDLNLNQQVLHLNGISAVQFAEAFAGHMEKANKGKLAIIGSVAGDRGRKSNYVYGAAKGLVTRYAQGLQHRFAKSGVQVTLIKPGPTDTPMTVSLKEKGAALASVEDVSSAIVKGVDSGAPTLYVPGKWKLIMLVIMHLPGFVFNKLNI